MRKVSSKKCAIDGCEKPFWAKGLCGTHYRRVQRTGAAEIRKPYASYGKGFGDRGRFWERVFKTKNCWFWIGAVDARNYGQFRPIESQLWYAHRYSYFVENGQFDETLQVLHKCDTPNCVNPDHLFIGTKLENNRDTVSKGRQHKNALKAVQQATEGT